MDEFDWLDDLSTKDRIIQLRTERNHLDHNGIARLGSHAAVMTRVAEIDAEVRVLEHQQNIEIERAFGLAQEVAELDKQGLVAIAPPDDILERHIPPREYCWANFYPTQACTALIGEGAVGKSIFALTQALHNAAGLPFLGQDTVPGTVVYFSAEDHQTEVWRRLQRIARRLPPEAQAAAVGNFRLIDAVGKRAYFVATKDGVAKIGAVVKRISDYIAAEFPDTRLVLIDTISRINGARENDNETMAAIVDAGELIAQTTGAAVVLLHHTSKAGAREGHDDLHAGRGGSALGDNARSMLRLMPAQEAHCKGLGVPRNERERGDILRLVHAKNSYGRRQGVVWLRRLSDGSLEPFEPDEVDTESRFHECLQQFLRWAAEQREPFNSRSVRNRVCRVEIWGTDVPEKLARDIYDKAVADRLVIDCETKRGGHPMQVINPATAERILLEAKALEDQFNVEES